MPLLHGPVFPVTLRGMTTKAWKRSSVVEEKRLTDDRKSLIERYQIDAAEAQARAQRAAEEQALQAEEDAKRAAAEEGARRASDDAQRAAEERACRRSCASAQTRRAPCEPERGPLEREP